MANVVVTCASNEFTSFSLLGGQTCGIYLADYISRAGGYLQDADATSDCHSCKIKDTNLHLASIDSEYVNRLGNPGIMWVYVLVDLAAPLRYNG